jgi:hypothetical protein
MTQIISFILLALLAQVFVWFQSNSQLFWEFWKDRFLLSALVYGIPASILFWYTTTLAYKHFGNLWSVRFLMFGLSYITFPLLTYIFAGESWLTPKTVVCTLLSFVIIAIQFYWK